MNLTYIQSSDVGVFIDSVIYGRKLMLFSKSDSNKSKTIEALIPMVDLFAVLAIVFMIYSSDEIIASQEKSQEPSSR